MWSTVSVCLLLLSAASGQRQQQTQRGERQGSVPQEQQFASDCPFPNGFFADAKQCDRYYHCVDGVLSEKLCPDGLAFVDHNPRIEKCDYTSQVDCTGRPVLQPAKPSGVCPRQNGYFNNEVATVCNKFYFCSDGTANEITCPEGLVFHNETNNCVWPDVANRPGCSASGVLKFDCPQVTHDVSLSHPRYADPDDCQFFYVCINGVSPRRNGCAFGHVYNSETQTCGEPLAVPECANYYTEYFEEYFKTLKTTDGRPSGHIVSAAIASGFKIPGLPSRISLQNNPSPINRKRRPSAFATATPPTHIAAVTIRNRPPTREQANLDVPIPIKSIRSRGRRPSRLRPAASPTSAPAVTFTDQAFTFEATPSLAPAHGFAPAPAPSLAPAPVPAPPLAAAEGREGFQRRSSVNVRRLRNRRPAAN